MHQIEDLDCTYVPNNHLHNYQPIPYLPTTYKPTNNLHTCLPTTYIPTSHLHTYQPFTYLPTNYILSYHLHVYQPTTCFPITSPTLPTTYMPTYQPTNDHEAQFFLTSWGVGRGTKHVREATLVSRNDVSGQNRIRKRVLRDRREASRRERAWLDGNFYSVGRWRRAWVTGPTRVP